MSETTQSSLCSLTDSIDDDLIPRDSLLPGQQQHPTLQRDNTKNSKQIFPEKELRRLSPNFHISNCVNSFIFVNKIKQKPNLEKENSLDLGPETGFNEYGSATLQCNGNPIHIFPEKDWRGLNPYFHIHVSVSNLYIPTIDRLQENLWTNPGKIYKSLTDTHEYGTLDWGCRNSFFGNT